jgi:glycosyltransferase involved in cell wall biosynthesis
LSFDNPAKAPGHSGGHFDSLPIAHRVLERDRVVTDADVPEADVVVATWWRTAEAVNALSPSRGAKVYFIQHDERVFNERPEHQAAREAVERSWRLPLHRVVVAKWIADEMVRTGVAGAIGVVPNAVDVEQFHAARRGKQETPTIGMLYAPVRFKGCDIGFAAFELAKKSVPHLRMVCLSDPEAPPGLPDGVEFVSRPSQDRIRDVYAACDAWLFCSRSEGFGLPILEAMACRTPVIGTPAGAAPDLIPQGGGMLVPHEDPRAMSDAICRILAMPETEWVQMSEAAHRTATSYSWDDAVARFERELERAIEGNRSGAARLGALRE